jgi:hypothetical protein
VGHNLLPSRSSNVSSCPADHPCGLQPTRPFRESLYCKQMLGDARVEKQPHGFPGICNWGFWKVQGLENITSFMIYLMVTCTRNIQYWYTGRITTTCIGEAIRLVGWRAHASSICLKSIQSPSEPQTTLINTTIPVFCSPPSSCRLIVQIQDIHSVLTHNATQNSSR